jgi:hypothetical protein
MFPWTTIGLVSVAYQDWLPFHISRVHCPFLAEEPTHLGSMRSHYIVLSRSATAI